MRYAWGPSWTHQPAEASFQDRQHEFCHRTVAEPVEPSETATAAVWGVAEADSVTQRRGRLHMARRSRPTGPSKRNRSTYRTRCGVMVNLGAPFDPATVPAADRCASCFPATKSGA
ncbi:hypothetical protein [Phycicoccus sp.]|uniref:hypothetical protein n=1 Tax=Phycicoccus sp. TaxID=1902410 RepID=UPI002C84FF57|nr:hypothetical protein [Phycicoccus sp.]HMM95286.1 hypothetical protein [Phycicoccus sp.]